MSKSWSLLFRLKISSFNERRILTMTEDDFKKLLEEVCKKENIEPSKVEEFYRERHKES